MSSDPDAVEVQARLRRMSKALDAPTDQAIWATLGLAAVGAIVTATVIATTRDLALALVIALGFLAAEALALVWAFRSLRRRQSTELMRDHGCREAKEWRQAAAGKLPRSRKGWERWLIEQPDAPGRFTVLLAFGRVAEAEAELDRFVARTPEDRFDAMLQRAQVATVRGEVADFDALRRLVQAISDRRRQAARKQCIAHLAAWQTFNRGEDPLEPLARGRRDAGLLERRSHIERYAFGLFMWPFLTMETVWVIGLFWVGF